MSLKAPPGSDSVDGTELGRLSAQRQIRNQGKPSPAKLLHLARLLSMDEESGLNTRLLEGAALGAPSKAWCLVM